MATKDRLPATRPPPARKSHAIKRGDSEPLTREDLQYDLLRHIFDDQHAVFTDPFRDEEYEKKVVFRDLYVSAFVNSPRSSKAVRDKISESAQFGTDFAMLALLANVGRINTTMASLRTYHPVPALQNTDGNLQDAPRIKNALKASKLPSELKGIPSTPSDILFQRNEGRTPSTSIINLLFVFNNHSTTIGHTHFDADDTLDFTDLFLPLPIPSAARARAFLWLCFHYLEPPTEPNPYADSERGSDVRAPHLPRLSAEEAKEAGENIDPPEEIDMSLKMMEHRQKFLTREDESLHSISKRLTERDASAGIESSLTQSGGLKARGKGTSAADPSLRGRPTKHQSREALMHKTSHQMLLDAGNPSAPSEPYPRIHLPAIQPAPAPSTSLNANPGAMALHAKTGRGRRTHEIVYAPVSPERTMLQHAWHVINTTDPLIESDGEQGDEHVRLDYTRRLKTLKRLRGKSPTPVLDTQRLPPVPMDIDDRNGW
ncbi:hypothetical protein EW145_g1248 [Phellinidium pouzarii]|uniref:Ino eighty subunit 1 n=1 Tax=Phellinidium pouzarii TaxID=167371 RepID=A0A4S4LF60_9AGAM|nr:hypothetical protein EW145_g1248 [Phellinidium pouzarii]